MNEHSFSNFSWPAVISMLMTLSSALTEIFYLRRVIMFTKINGLITKGEAKIIAKAARILMSSDRHDAYFFAKCQELDCGIDSRNHIVHLSADFAIVKHQEVSKQQTVSVREITDNSNTQNAKFMLQEDRKL